jgi:hypothetical protein
MTAILTPVHASTTSVVATTPETNNYTQLQTPIHHTYKQFK